MNRIIKFRVWDLEFKELLYGPECMVSTEGRLYLNYKTGTIKSFGDGKYIIQQFTGLKDDKNKDIYEGDILRVESYDGWFDKEPNYYNLLVEYRISPSGDSDLSGFLYIPKFREVIGNIYENPELLRSAK